MIISSLHASVAIQEDKGGGGGNSLVEEEEEEEDGDDDNDDDDDSIASLFDVESSEGDKVVDSAEVAAADDDEAAASEPLEVEAEGVFGDVAFEDGVVRLGDATVVAFALSESLFVERETTSALYPDTVCVTRLSNKSRFRNKEYVKTPFDSY